MTFSFKQFVSHLGHLVALKKCEDEKSLEVRGKRVQFIPKFVSRN